MMRRPGLALVLLASATACARPETSSAPARAELVRLSGATMGTTWSAALVADRTREPELARELQEVLDRVDARMSTYRPDSEVSRFSALPLGPDGTASLEVSEETAAVVRLALEVAERSGGAFDPTVGPLVRLWGFGPDPAPNRAPSPEELAAARARIGWQALRVEGDRLVKTRDGLELDLSAVAKGYAVDAALDRLAELGVPDALVEVGGEVGARGRRPGGAPWRVGIDLPREGSLPGQELQLVVPLSDRALATSGDYRNYHVVEGRRVGHEIDPRTGLPVEHDLASVSVVAPSCALADALATACFVLGPEEGMALVTEWDGVEALFVRRTEDGFSVERSAGFPEPLER